VSAAPTAAVGAAAGAGAVGPRAGRDWTADIDTLRARGAGRLDPIHFCFIEALARRAAAQQGELRRLLDERLAHTLGAFSLRLAQAQTCVGARCPSTALPRPDANAAAPQRRPLAELLARIGSPVQPSFAAGPGPGDALADTSEEDGELKAMRYFRSTWSRLRVDRQLKLSMARLPENAGPLHTERLVLRALQAMRDISPAYLDHFVSQVDALLWLEQAQAGSPPAPAKAARGARLVARAPRPGHNRSEAQT
jgi:hypothetical protein